MVPEQELVVRSGDLRRWPNPCWAVPVLRARAGIRSPWVGWARLLVPCWEVVAGQREGLSAEGTHPIQVAWKEFDTPQCGYCQSGMIMSALALLQRRASPSDADIDAAVTNACRCGSYHRVRRAIHLAADLMKAGRR